MKITKLHLQAFSPTNFLTKLSAHETFPVLMRTGEWTILSWNPVKRYEWTSAKKAQKDLKKLHAARHVRSAESLPFVGGIIGSVSSDAGYELLDLKPKAKDRWRLPVVQAGVYEEALLWNGKEIFVIGSKKFAAEVFKIHGRRVSDKKVPTLKFHSSIPEKKYAADFKKIQRHILAGDVYQLNLTYTLDASSPCEDRMLFQKLFQKNLAPCAAYLDAGSHRLLSFSPERFIKIEKGSIETCPIKGTRPRGIGPRADTRFRQELLGSAKEQAELSMITDLLRNDIGRIATIGSVRVAEKRLVKGLVAVWHTSSRIVAELDPRLSPIDALFSMLPAGSVTGCPKRRAFELIDAIEKVRRGPYTGVLFSLSDHGVLDSSIVIRTLVRKGRTLSLGVGGGIVADSDVRSEWEETKHKAKPFILAPAAPLRGRGGI